MGIFHELGELSLTEADIIRTTIKKKKPELVKPYKIRFIKGCIHNGMTKTKAKELFEQLMIFSLYSFNRSHSASYSYIGYVSQLLKVNYQIEFITALLDYADKEERKKIFNYLNKEQIKFRLPHINKSKEKFYLKGNTIIFPFNVMNGVGKKASVVIVEKQPYDSFEDFFNRIEKRKCNKRIIVNLIISGVFDDFGIPQDLINQFFSLRKEKVPEELVNLSKRKWLTLKNNVLNLQVVSLKRLYSKKLKDLNVYEMINTYDEFENKQIGEPVAVLGKVLRFKEIDSKRGKMAFINLADGDNNYKIICWSEFWKAFGITLKIGSVLVVMGYKKMGRDKETQIELDRGGKIWKI